MHACTERVHTKRTAARGTSAIRLSPRLPPRRTVCAAGAADSELGGEAIPFETTPWHAATANEVRDELRERMGAVITTHALPARPWDLWCALLVGAHLPRTTRTMSQEQFKLGVMTSFGFSKNPIGASGGGGGNSTSSGYKRQAYTSLSMSKLSDRNGQRGGGAEGEALSAAFTAIDEMSDRRDHGSISYDDFLAWINGCVTTQRRAREINFGTRARRPGFEAVSHANSPSGPHPPLHPAHLPLTPPPTRPSTRPPTAAGRDRLDRGHRARGDADHAARRVASPLRPRPVAGV